MIVVTKLQTWCFGSRLARGGMNAECRVQSAECRVQSRSRKYYSLFDNSVLQSAICILHSALALFAAYLHRLDSESWSGKGTIWIEIVAYHIDIVEHLVRRASNG